LEIAISLRLKKLVKIKNPIQILNQLKQIIGLFKEAITAMHDFYFAAVTLFLIGFIGVLYMRDSGKDAIIDALNQKVYETKTACDSTLAADLKRYNQTLIMYKEKHDSMYYLLKYRKK
jgi:hypothetical protein